MEGARFTHRSDVSLESVPHAWPDDGVVTMSQRGEAALPSLQNQTGGASMSLSFEAADPKAWPRITEAMGRLGLHYWVQSVQGFGLPRLYCGPDELIGEQEILEALPRIKQLVG